MASAADATSSETAVLEGKRGITARRGGGRSAQLIPSGYPQFPQIAWGRGDTGAFTVMALKLMKRACPGARRFTESAVKRASRAAYSGAASARALSVALERLTYDRSAKAVTYRSDTSEGPTAGTETADPLEFLARVRVHLPDKDRVTTRYDGWYGNRPRGMRRQAEPAPAEAPPAIAPALRLAPTEASRRRA